MIKEYIKTLSHVIRMRSIIGFNGLVYALRMTPVIGRIIPDSLYRSSILKVIYWIFHIFKEIGKLFIGKIFGLSLIYLVSLFMTTEYVEGGQAQGISEPVLFGSFALFFFILYALCGILINIPMFRCTTEKEYLVFMLRMNAKELNNTLFIYDLAKLFTGYLIVGVVAALFGAPVRVWLYIPFLSVFIKLFGTGARASLLEFKEKHHRKMNISTGGMTAMVLLTMLPPPLILAVVLNGYYVPLKILFPVSFLLIMLGIWGAFKIMSFRPELHRRALRDNIVRNEVSKAKEKDTTGQFKHLTASGDVKGDKKGFDYLNALFIRRHRKMLLIKPVIFTLLTITVMALFIVGFISDYKRQFGADNTVSMVMHNLMNLLLFKCYEDDLLPFDPQSPIAFFRYLATTHLMAMIFPIACSDITFKATQAMYINCDNSLMTFSFFKMRDKIIKLYDIRLIQIIKINAVPALAYGLLADMFIFYTGGQDYPFQYLITVSVPIIMSVIASAAELSLYYLLQPFTTTVNVKGGAYMVIKTVTGIILVNLFWIPLDSLILAPVLLGIAVLEIILLRKLVYLKAPRTWRIKS